MTIYEKINEAIRNEKDITKRNFLKLLKSEIEAQKFRQTKELSNEQESNILLRVRKANQDTIDMRFAMPLEKYNLLVQEIEAIDSFLPPILSLEETRALIDTFEDKSTGAVFKKLKQIKDIRYNPEFVKKIIEEKTNV